MYNSPDERDHIGQSYPMISQPTSGEICVRSATCTYQFLQLSDLSYSLLSLSIYHPQYSTESNVPNSQFATKNRRDSHSRARNLSHLLLLFAPTHSFLRLWEWEVESSTVD